MSTILSNEADANDQQQQQPCRGIFNDVDMKHFMESSTKKELLNFVEAMGKACSHDIQTTTATAAFDPSQPLLDLTLPMACLHGSLQEMVRWVDDFPPSVEAVRFGNPAFRLWHQRLIERSEAIITVILQARGSGGGDDNDDGSEMNNTRCKKNMLTPEAACQRGKDAAAGLLHPQGDDSIQHVSCYLHDSFGHATRLDYGTGHESSFFVFLLVLSKVKCMGDSPSLKTLRAITLSIVDQYLKVTRRIQTDYRLEPAGSHGVWGLDDYHCIPFYLGACQLQCTGVYPQELLDPKCQNDDHILREYGDIYMYLGCIRYIRQLKQGVPFFESSPMLYDISQTLPSWNKVARGLLRLYQGEVLDKRQVVQHFVFSKLFPCTWTPSRSTMAVAPTELFRKVDENNTTMPAVTIPTTRAPWAISSNRSNGMDSDTTTVPTIMTRAPWSTKNAEDTER
jgi:Phosphotyrosyl phosphate activator (PTPA) protein